MKLFPDELVVSDDEGFSTNKDIFGRRAFGDQLFRIIKSLGGKRVLLLDAPWGSGKTVFLKMWRGYLAQRGISSIYFDAFANDYHDDAFVAIASQILSEARATSSVAVKAKKVFTKNAVKVAKTLAWTAANIGIRAATVGIVDAEQLKSAGAEIAKIAGDETAKTIDKVLKNRLENHKKDETLFSDFRENLSELAFSISKEVAARAGRKKALPLVIIIDELDRCKPTFALSLLEKIKHFFSVPNVIFVLAGTMDQFEAAVKFSYGDVKAREYLEKFYHLKVSFPTKGLLRSDLGASTYLRHLECNQNIGTIIEIYAQAFPLSFRTMEKIVAYTKILLLSLGRGILIPELISSLCILKVINPPLYNLAQKGEITFQQIFDFMDMKRLDEVSRLSNRQHIPSGLEQWWRTALNQAVDDKIRIQHEQRLNSAGIEPLRIIPFYCDMIDGISFPDEEEG